MQEYTTADHNGNTFTVRIDGTIVQHEKTDGMLIPVKCNHCGQVYDLCAGKPVHRYQDCTLFTTPCCGAMADDRVGKTCPDFTKIEKAQS